MFFIFKNGEISKDGLFKLLEVECLGACDDAPIIQLNDDYYECLTPDAMIALLDACKEGKAPPMGKWGSSPMNGQVSCEGPVRKTSLFGNCTENHLALLQETCVTVGDLHHCKQLVSLQATCITVGEFRHHMSLASLQVTYAA